MDLSTPQDGALGLESVGSGPAPVADGVRQGEHVAIELSADAFAAALADAFARITTAQVLSACAVACARIEGE